jgi:hypothetical protein
VWNKRRVVGRGQIHETNAVGKVVAPRVGDRDSEAGLPHAAGAHKGHKSCKVECSGHALDVTLPANEGCGCGEAAHNRMMVAGEVRNFDVLRLDRFHELVSVSYDRRDVGWLGKSILQRPA